MADALRLELDLSSMVLALDRMGARPVPVDLNAELPRLELGGGLGSRLLEGVSIDPREVDVTDGGLLSYQGYQVVLYIPDQGERIDDVLRNGQKGTRFHVAYCHTLQSMAAEGRYQRYIARSGQDHHFRVHGLRKPRRGKVTPVEGDDVRAWS